MTRVGRGRPSSADHVHAELLEREAGHGGADDVCVGGLGPVDKCAMRGLAVSAVHLDGDLFLVAERVAASTVMPLPCAAKDSLARRACRSGVSWSGDAGRRNSTWVRAQGADAAVSGGRHRSRSLAAELELRVARASDDRHGGGGGSRRCRRQRP